MNTTTTTTTYPATIRELGDMANDRDVLPSEMLASLPTPPAGYTLDEDSVDHDGEGVWIGPDIKGQGWTVLSQWTRESGVTFFVDGDHNNAMPAAEAGKIAAALAEVAAMI